MQMRWIVEENGREVTYDIPDSRRDLYQERMNKARERGMIAYLVTLLLLTFFWQDTWVPENVVAYVPYIGFPVAAIVSWVFASVVPGMIRDASVDRDIAYFKQHGRWPGQTAEDDREGADSPPPA